MTHVLVVPAGKLSNPMPLVIGMKAGNRLLHDQYSLSVTLQSFMRTDGDSVEVCVDDIILVRIVTLILARRNVMPISDLMIPELDDEMARTRVILAAVPKQYLDWQPAEAMHSIGWNANHLADIVGWTQPILEQDEFDIAPVDGPAHETPSIDDPVEILASFDANLAAARTAIAAATDQQLAADWSMKMGGQTLFTISKGDCLRRWVINHSIHHRGILSVYLRMCGVPLTPVYDS
jgi:uncharacterized damage-inducible protein DinB